MVGEITVSRAIDPLVENQAIVDPETGNPTAYFLRQWLSQSGLNGDGATVAEVVEALLLVNLLAGVALEGGGALSALVDISFDLEDTAVTPDVYGDALNVPVFTVDQQGRITAAAEVAITFPDAYLPTVSGYFDGAPDADAVLARYVASQALSFPDALAGSQGFLETAATAETIFVVKRNNIQIGTMTFAIAGTVATFATSASQAYPLVAGDRISVHAPSTPDATAAGISFSLQSA